MTLTHFLPSNLFSCRLLNRPARHALVQVQKKDGPCCALSAFDLPSFFWKPKGPSSGATPQAGTTGTCEQAHPSA
ncbi:hypothetical protein ACCO45_003076 [Purpureocillium lilacinum]|uniref:Uncharacterized protein n=1 Tax=Purpureocillium lilacinum TaxID=33203 RepID=A0ACC4E200_PURLI